MLSNKILYLDSASSTKIDPEILETYYKIYQKYYANSSAIHKLGTKIKELEDLSRQQILDLLNVKNYRLIFTSGATEANNMAIKSVALSRKNLGKHLITTEIEHASVYNSFKFLEDYFGFEVTYLKVNEKGLIDLEELKASLRPDTILVSIMSVNNEIGSIIDPQSWAKIVKDNSNALCHVDMVQALGKIDIDFQHIDLASFSAHKINGVNGSGFLLVRDYIKLIPLISGGNHQDGFRSGTTNHPANIVLAKTVRLCLENQQAANSKLKKLSDYLYEQLSLISEVSINTPKDNSIYNIVNFSVKGVGSEIMMNALSNKNIFVSAGSTCTIDLNSDSSVLRAIGKDISTQRGRIRVSLDSSLSIEDLEFFISELKENILKYAI